MSAVRVISYLSWAEFKRDLFVELFEDGMFRRGRYLFRGVRDADWALVSTFDRDFAGVPLAVRMALWEEVQEQWRSSCREAGIPDAGAADDHRLLALGRHHHLPTRLLDWSTSPYIASYFAYREHLAGGPAAARHVAIWVLHLDDPVWSAGGVDVIVDGAVAGDRQRNQNGTFTLCRAAVTALEDYVERFAHGTALTKCVLPVSESRVALADLDAMGVNGYALFPDLAGLAARATMRACLTVME